MAKRLRFMGAICLMSGGAAASPGGDSPEAAFNRYRTQINLHDFDLLAKTVIAPDAQFYFAGEEHRGIEAARAAFNSTWSTIPDEIYEMDDAQWLARDADSAVVAFRYRYRGTLRNGTAVAGGGRGTNLYVLTPTGWRLTYEHLSHDPVAKSAD